MKIGVRTLMVVFLAGSALGAVARDVRQLKSVDRLVDEFEKAGVFWRQLEVAKQVVNTGDSRALQRLEHWLDHEDRHLRGNAAFVFAGLGDARGLETIVLMVTDRAPRPEGQGIPGGGFSEAGQIRADRYYAVHLLGELKDSRAVDRLVTLLNDGEINYKVAWALGEIGDTRATPPLMAALANRDGLVRVSAIEALVKLRATEALPKLHGLLSDDAMPSGGNRPSVAETARAAIARLQKEP